MTDEPATSRRAFLAGTAAAGAGLVATSASAETPDPLITEVQEWASIFGDAVDATPYGMPIEFESHVVRRNVEWLTESTASSINFTPIHALEGTITPQGCAFERHHSGAISLSKSDYRLMINGLVDKPLVFTFEDLLRFPRQITTAFCECAANGGMEWGGAQLEGCQFTQGMIHNMEYTGVMLRDLLAEAGVQTAGKWIYVEGADASSNGRSIPMEKALDDVMVAFFANGEALRKEHGYPVRLVVPGWEGNMWVKWVRRIGVYDQAVESREETSKYTDLMPDGRARKWTWVMDAKSVITSPSPQAPIRHGAGPLVITGLAWSGNGRITRVDVSTDGGNSWTPARISGDAKSKALTRFHHDINWDGQEMFIMSRAVDETGYVQPTKQALRDIRGLNNVYHNNGIQVWWVRADGEVENVEIAELALASALLTTLAAPAFAETLGLGRPALPEEIAAWDVAVLPDGTGLPEGSGDVETGDEVFAENCASCHGDFAEGLDSWPVLAGGAGSLTDPRPVKTVGSYWPYLSTVFDYVHRSMPFGQAQTLSVDDTYAITAFLLYSNGMVEDDFVLSNENFTSIVMPNADGFYPDDRPATEYPLFSAEPCMENCRTTAPEVTKRAVEINVTPEDPDGKPAGTLPVIAAALTEGTTAATTETAEVTEEPAAEATEAAAEAAVEAPAPTAADPALVAAGEAVFKKCAACHKIGEGAKNGVGPALNGIVNAAMGQAEGFKYSKTLAEMGAGGGVWDDASLHAFLENPKAFVKGTKMAFAGLKKPEDRDSVIAYLATFGP